MIKEPASEQSDLRVSVAVVDDDTDIADLVARSLELAGCEPHVFNRAADCLDFMAESPAAIVITDLKMPGMDGLQLLKIIRERWPDTEVIVITGFAEKSDAVTALKLGAYDFFEKPFDRESLIQTVRRTVRYRQALRDRDQYANQLSLVSAQQAKQWGIEAFVGKSESVQRVLKSIRLLQRASTTPALLLGESGTGKELIARAIHFGSNRSNRPFVPVNCSAIPSELAESMLFGHARGAFTGAVQDKKGAFELAHEGTIFLDEVGDMPAVLQAKLLRVLEDGMVVPVGRTEGRHIDVRVIAATNADLKSRIEDGRFRLDLFYRLAGFTVEIQPLRDRPDDIPLLVEHFTHLLAAEMGFPPPAVDPRAMERLLQHRYLGNVRELKNIIERALLESGGQDIEPDHVHLLQMGSGESTEEAAPLPSREALPGTLPLDLLQAEKLLIEKALQQAEGNMAAAARLLGINRTKLYRKIAVHGLKGSPGEASADAESDEG